MDFGSDKLIVFSVWNHGPVLHARQVVGNDSSRNIFQIFLIRCEKQAFRLIIILGCSHLIIFIVVLDIVFFDKLVLSHNRRIVRQE